MNTPLWVPSQETVGESNMVRFMAHLHERCGVELPDYPALHRWTIESPEVFWSQLWDFCDVRASVKGERVLDNPYAMPGARWFPDAQLNFAQNLLRRRDGAPAIFFRGEDRVEQTVGFAELYDSVSQMAQAMRASGVGVGDRVAGYLPNMPHTIIAMLAATSLGAVWSSCSPDFGSQGVIDRFGQIEPKLFITADGYFYGGKSIDSLANVPAIVAEIPSIEQVIVVPYLSLDVELALDQDVLPGAKTWGEFVAPYSPDEIDFAQLPFAHPLYIMYSSGTTGVPKCIVHSAGGTLIQHLKEHVLHADVRPDDRVFYFTTCGWMMWNWLVSGLAAQAALVLFDGAPFYPDARTLLDYADDVGINVFGTSAKYIDALKKSGLNPRETHSLATVRTILSTGSPLAEESFDFVYEHVKVDVRLSSITGGTDILGCFAQGAPILPVWRGELQCLALGMDVAVFDDEGNSVTGEKGELVCRAPFPSMPIGFWRDDGDVKYRAAYFEKFPNVWCHGDYVALTEHGGLIVHGRSDAVLNPGGVRIGTAEIYRQVEQLGDVEEALVIGQDWQSDTRVVLFVRLRDGLTIDDTLEAKIRDQVRRNTTPRHVPSRIVQVEDIPRTKSGKIVELAVREVVHGRKIKNREALANPEALAHFANRPELAS
jgi:acetoacetyl-CoA synthetase